MREKEGSVEQVYSRDQNVIHLGVVGRGTGLGQAARARVEGGTASLAGGDGERALFILKCPEEI